MSTFPGRPVLGVHVRHIRQTSGPGQVAIVDVDFEPAADGVTIGVAADVDTGDYSFPEDVPRYVEALGEGVCAELAEIGAAPAVAVTVRRIRMHEVDSNEMAFTVAGRLAVREALRRDGDPSGPPDAR
ncbi:elongation factor G-like protein [Herbihabitans rhizosphaerae]|uniref:Elongation factor G-like protein n=1 Tax=Herbihabitans rhizosphaerae TaxID=1872711 RepID=A0A4V2EU80_9PSEU|nr:hypothetical protein [Herbihabitans rhizosphaerae]RZS43643.1 elongation factor G-like protein [Herbihabitans rhizosphaerae]